MTLTRTASLLIALFAATVYSYTPTNLVKDGHKMPHADFSLQPASNKFDMSSMNSFLSVESSNSYAISIITFPAILLSLGFLSLLIYGVIAASKLFCACFTCCKSRTAEDIETKFGVCFVVLLFCCFVDIIHDA